MPDGAASSSETFRRDFADHRVARQQARHVAVGGVGLVGEVGIARAEDHGGDDVLAGLFLDLAVHVDARQDAETFGGERLGGALDGMVEAVGDLAFEIDAAMMSPLLVDGRQACPDGWRCRAAVWFSLPERKSIGDFPPAGQTAAAAAGLPPAAPRIRHAQAGAVPRMMPCGRRSSEQCGGKGEQLVGVGVKQFLGDPAAWRLAPDVFLRRAGSSSRAVTGLISTNWTSFVCVAKHQQLRRCGLRGR